MGGGDHIYIYLYTVYTGILGEVLRYDPKLLAARHEGKGQKSALIE